MLNESNIPLEEDGIEEEILVDEEVSITKAMWGDIGGNIENQTDLQNALDAKQDSLTEAQLNAVNSGITSEKVTTYDGYADQIASKANQSALNAESIARGEADTALGTRIDNEALARQQADNGLQSQIDAITSQSDVVDVVANYAALQAYDTSSLSDNDVIKVLDDETHEDALTYYRWSTTTQTWSYIGQEAPYYSKGQMDVMLQGKQDTLTAGANIQIENGVISGTDTTYTAGNGLNLNGTEFSADTDVLATKEDLEDYYTKPEADNLLAPKLEAEGVAELPTTGEEGKLYLTPKAHTTQTATGNPITATVAEEAGKIESFQLDGDTFQQSYEGKNLLELYPGHNETVTLNGITATYNTDEQTVTFNGMSDSDNITFRILNKDVDITARTTRVTTYWLGGSVSGYCTVRFFDNSYQGLSYSIAILSSTTPIISNTTSNTTTISRYTSVRFNQGSVATNFKIKFMVADSEDTAWEPYVGGTPSPNPDYPQPIQTVTGEQTISINGTDYPLDLGAIELCGLGDDGNGNPLYKDRIYRDGEDWKVHKETGKYTFDGTEQWGSTGTGNHSCYSTAITGYATSDNVPYSPYFSGISNVSGAGTMNTKPDNSIAFIDQSATVRFYIKSSKFENDALALKTWLSTHNTDVYYALATATDTTITDTALIAQLEAIRTALLKNGANTITNTAAGSNLAGDMEIGYYGYNPRNRYDKWLWLDINNEYEQIGS